MIQTATLPFADDPPKQRHYLRLVRRGMPHENALAIAGGPFGGGSAGVIPDRAFPHCSDGFANDDAGRKICFGNAKRAGIPTAGKVYVPGMARKGMGSGRDPQAWIDGNRSEIINHCKKNNCSSEGRVSYEAPSAATKPLKPYKVADRHAQAEVDGICATEGIRPDKKKRDDMVEAASERLSGGS